MLASTSSSCSFCRSPVSCMSSPPKETYTCTLICTEHHQIKSMPLVHRVALALCVFAEGKCNAAATGDIHLAAPSS